MDKGIQPFLGQSQNYSRNQLMQRWDCGRRLLQILEDVAIDLIPDFRESLSYPEVIGYRHPDGSIEARLRRSAELSPYHVWVLGKLLKLRRKSYESFEDRAFKTRNQLSKEKFNAQ